MNIRRTLKTFVIPVILALTVSGCAGWQGLFGNNETLFDETADQLIFEADGHIPRALRFEFVSLVVCQLIQNGVDEKKVTKHAVNSDCSELRRSANNIWLYGFTKQPWFETEMRFATLKLITITRQAVRRRGDGLFSLIPGMKTVELLRLAGRVLNHVGTVETMLLDYDEMKNLPPEKIRTAFTARWVKLASSNPQ